MNHPTPTLERVLQAVRDLSLVYGDRRYIHVEMAQTTIDDIAESVLGPGQRFGDLPVQLIGIPVIVNDTIPQGRELPRRRAVAIDRHVELRQL